jgi:hypothetical protein
MSFSFIGSDGVYNAAGGTTLDTDSALNVAEGDLLVGVFQGWGDPGTITMADTDGVTNVFTMLTKSNSGSLFMRIGYVLSATADAAALFRASNTNSVGYRGFFIYQFRPDAGDTVSYDVGDVPAGGSSQTPQSANADTTGDDEAAVAGLYLENGKTWADNRWIGDDASSGALDPVNYCHAWYNLFTATKANCHAQADMLGSDAWLIDYAAFKSTGGGGGAVTYSKQFLVLKSR